MIPLLSSSPCTTTAMYRTYPRPSRRQLWFLQKSVLIAPDPAHHVVHHDDDEAALHYTATVLVALQDEGEVLYVTEAATVLSTVSSDRPLTLPTMSLTTMTMKQPFMTPLPSSSPCTTTATVRSVRPPTLPTMSLTTMTTNQLFMIPLPSVSPCTDNGKVPNVPEAVQEAATVPPTLGSDRSPTLPTTSFTTMTTKQLFMTLLPSSLPCTTMAKYRTYPRLSTRQLRFFQPVGSVRPPTQLTTSFTTMTSDAALHDTAVILVTLHDKGKVPDVPETVHQAATVPPTVSSDRPTTLAPQVAHHYHNEAALDDIAALSVSLQDNGEATGRTRGRPRGSYSYSNSRF